MLGRAAQSSPKPAGSRRRREGLTAKARAKPIMSRAMAASRVLYPCQTRGSPVVVRCDFSVYVRCCDVRGAFDALDPRRSPLSKLCDARRINLYPVGIEPKPRSLMQHCEGRGAPRKMGPIFRTASCSHASGRSRIQLGLDVPLVVFKTPCTNHPFRTAPVGTTPVSR